MTDAEVKSESFLEYLNSFLSTGEIAGLLAKDERDIAMIDIKSVFPLPNPQYEPTQSEVYRFMIDRIRDNCHLVMAFSPVGKKFRDRAIDFPALFNNCSINWFLGWPEEALTDVAHSFINNFHIDVQNPETKKELEG